MSSLRIITIIPNVIYVLRIWIDIEKSVNQGTSRIYLCTVNEFNTQQIQFQLCWLTVSRHLDTFHSKLPATNVLNWRQLLFQICWSNWITTIFGQKWIYRHRFMPNKIKLYHFPNVFRQTHKYQCNYLVSNWIFYYFDKLNKAYIVIWHFAAKIEFVRKIWKFNYDWITPRTMPPITFQHSYISLYYVVSTNSYTSYTKLCEIEEFQKQHSEER